MTLLDLTASNVMSLGDEDLRSLVVRLCEAELRNSGQTLASLSSGGDQNANDGGIDLAISAAATATSWLPKTPLGIQIKSEPMPPRKITREMYKHAQLRPTIQNLADNQGAYIIACGSDNCTFSMLESRQEAMRCSLQKELSAEIFVDFYDADKLARWASSHPSVALWLKEKSGVPAQGWRGYGRWATQSPEQTDDYLSDNFARASFDRLNDQLSAPEAIDKVRALLAAPRAAVRLVGLSGMGKTRFAQALFEELPVCNEHPLNQSRAVYGDAAVTAGSAELMASQLALRSDRAILLVDNCPAALHRRLVPLIQSAGSNTSLLTVDFDIGDDQPEHTTVLRLSPADDNLIERLLRTRARNLSATDIQRVAEFSGGNARIALALARSSDVSGLAKLRDQELLDRLFLTDRRAPDEVLRRVARVGSLVYAFDIEQTDNNEELCHLASLAQVSVDTFYEKIGELLERGLAQQRGSQRAILPQSLAARLAEEALDRVQTENIWRELCEAAPMRLRRSFSRRLGLLHTSERARQLAERLLAEATKMDSGADDNSDAWYMVENLAPVSPESAMKFMERKFQRRDPALAWWARGRDSRLLLALAHDPEHFHRAAVALGAIATAERSKNMGNNNLKAFQCLFQISRSGTWAPPHSKFDLMVNLLQSPDPVELALGVDAISAAMRARIEPMGAISSFGARTLTTGWAPDTDEEIVEWFEEAVDLAINATGRAPELWPVIADRLGEMLAIPILRSFAIGKLTQRAREGFWRDGWFAICRAIAKIKVDGNSVDAQLTDAYQKLGPRSVDERFDSWVLGEVRNWQDPSGRRSDSWEKFYQNGQQLGIDAANSPATRRHLLRRSMSRSDAKSYCLGQGIGQAIKLPDAGWAEILAEISASDRPESATTFLRGYLNGVGCTRPATVELWLDELFSSPKFLGLLTPVQLAARPIGDKGGTRLLYSLKNRRDEVEKYFPELQLGGISKTIPDSTLAKILRTLANTTEGNSIAIDILHMRFHGEGSPSRTLKSAGRALLAGHNFVFGQDRDHSIVEVALKVLNGRIGEKTSIQIVDYLLKLTKAGGAVPRCQELLSVIFSLHPISVLDRIYEATTLDRHPHLEWFLGGVDSDDGPEVRPIASVPDDVLYEWVCVAPDDRARFVSAYVSYFSNRNDKMHWSLLASRLMRIPGQELHVLKAFQRRFSVGSWTGSAASRFYRRLDMIRPQLSDSNQQVAAWARAATDWLSQRIEEENRRDRHQGERFE